MSEKPTHFKTRIVSVVAATTIALACGTNYAYSAWAPQFAEKLQLSTTQSNGTAANLGMYAVGIPMGIITDRKSPRLAAIIGMFALGLGYYPIRSAYDQGVGSMSVSLISFCSFLTGVGSCAAFQGALKTATLNWPTHRGTATAFPLAAFGLSAFFFTLIAGIAFPGDTSGFLLLLSIATSAIVLVSIPFLHVVDHHSPSSYAALPTSERTRRDSNVMHRHKPTAGSGTFSRSAVLEPEPNNDEQDGDSETSSLLSGPGDIIDGPAADDNRSQSTTRSHWLDITGFDLLSKTEFWQLWILMGLLTGVGLMTINNIGHDVQALWNHYDESVDKDFVAHRQLMHVSIISIFSFIGRLTSGIGSDIIVKKLHMSRYWCAAISATVFMLGQICAINIEDPHYLWTLSALNGLAYGILFGALPALVVDSFGPQGFAVNWGVMTLAPVVSGNIYNLFYGAVYDSHSGVQRGGERSCDKGAVCYRAAYYVTFVSSILGILACFWGIRHEHVLKRKAEEEHEGHRDA
ncbi:MFS general substrate transporter [Aaosphaeria arxii CBS 175.79]|uniref:MFS general substrate transporter n=1 Tax=Aaosphaeria arxii CBS 175.79 TaxID=1450172 RepID=A0A6A5XC33_9PLEO|nr:MFS general substrate transporter [Aaosphaeria arxii CBS 175.79]KAF2010463.1 MFS general substrate transporter [Aaosphaeria arxii CBS 175.79]